MKTLLVFFVLLSALVLPLVSVSAQDLNYTAVPQQAFGYTLGSSLSSIETALKSAKIDFREQPSTRPAPSMTLEIPRQTVQSIPEVTIRLFFAKETLYQIQASMAYDARLLGSFKDDLVKQYGPVRSLDGGFHYLWFFNQNTVQNAQQRPDFAVILANDPVTDKTVSLTYADNLRRDQVLGTATVVPQKDGAAPPAPSAATVNPVPKN